MMRHYGHFYWETSQHKVENIYSIYVSHMKFALCNKIGSLTHGGGGGKKGSNWSTIRGSAR